QAAHRRHPMEALVLAGGCAQNSVANGKVYRQSPIRKVYVQAAAGDSGGAMGAAFVAWRRVAQSRPQAMEHAYWGPEFTDEECVAALGARSAELSEAGCTQEHFDSEDALCRRVASLITEGCVIGWFQGSMEWGPRALGNRSILADPRRSDMK